MKALHWSTFIIYNTHSMDIRLEDEINPLPECHDESMGPLSGTFHHFLIRKALRIFGHLMQILPC